MGWLLPPATGVRQGFRGVYAALAERHSHVGECASCKEGWDGGDAFGDTPIPTFPHNCGGRSQPTTPLPCFSIPPFNLWVNNLLRTNGSLLIPFVVSSACAEPVEASIIKGVSDDLFCSTTGVRVNCFVPNKSSQQAIPMVFEIPTRWLRGRRGTVGECHKTIDADLFNHSLTTH